MFRKILLYGLPLYLYGLEIFLKAIASITSESLLGPTLAGAGIGFLLPLTELKQVQLDQNVVAQLKANNARAYSQRDKTFVDFVWIFFFAALGAWMYSIFLSYRPAQGWSWSPSVVIGCVVFIVSLVLCEIKEKV